MKLHSRIQTLNRTDFRPFPFHVVRLDLVIDIVSEAECMVRSHFHVERKPGFDDSEPLVLNGSHLELVSASINGRRMRAAQFEHHGEEMHILGLASVASLRFVTRISLKRDHGYMGIYRQGDIVLADGEPNGFRHITYFPDRPDVKTVFGVTLRAAVEPFPVLLSNGQPAAAGRLAGGRHFVFWRDRLPKSCYVFSFVAGSFSRLEDTYITGSSHRVALTVYASGREIRQCAEGLAILKRAMLWEEQQFHREYDSNLLNIVVIRDYNQGGMEYRGLNIFGSGNFRLAGTDIDDEGKMRGDATIAHEYFHNWTGNRVSCRDWFNLTVKEGMVVFMSQEFSAAITDPSIQRILDVRYLREYQFEEDDSDAPQAPRPDTCIAVQNLYTRTSYEKGAEIIRMLRLILGPDAFSAGCRQFYTRYDLQSAEIEDMILAFELASGRSLSAFARWYTQPGRPLLHVDESYDSVAATYTLNFTQYCRGGERSVPTLPFVIPITLALLSDDGVELPLQMKCDVRAEGTIRTLEMSAAQMTLEFVNMCQKPTASLLRNFSAPVSMYMKHDRSARALLMLQDTDALSRWNAGQGWFTDLVLEAVAGRNNDRDREHYCTTIKRLLSDASVLANIVGLQLRAPSEATIGSGTKPLEIDAVHTQRKLLEAELGSSARPQLHEAFERSTGLKKKSFSSDVVTSRILKNECLRLLTLGGASDAVALCHIQLKEAAEITDQLGALRALMAVSHPSADAALLEFYDRWKQDAPVIGAWVALQAAAEIRETPARLRALLDRGMVQLDDAPGLRSLFDQFPRNQIGFHARDGGGYKLVADVALRLNTTNPRMAARFMIGFKSIGRVDEFRHGLMRQQLCRIQESVGISAELYELAHECLHQNSVH